MPNAKIVFQDAKVIFRNFTGKETDFNTKGQRNFCVVIPNDEQAQALANEGWYVKIVDKGDPEIEPLRFIKVKVRYDNYPPKVYLVTGSKKTLLTEETIGQLDKADIKRADLQISQSRWERMGAGGKKTSGVTAYLDKAYFVLNEDELEMMYADIPEACDTLSNLTEDIMTDEVPFN